MRTRQPSATPPRALRTPRTRRPRATLRVYKFGQLKAADYLSWQSAPHKMGEGIISQPLWRAKNRFQPTIEPTPTDASADGDAWFHFMCFQNLNGAPGTQLPGASFRASRRSDSRSNGSHGWGLGPRPRIYPRTLTWLWLRARARRRACARARHNCGGSGGVGVGWPALLYRSPPRRGMGRPHGCSWARL